MAFKMKGFPLQAGTAPAKKYASDAQRKAIYASKAEEAEKKKRSVATQKSADQKTIEELIEEGFTPADARRMQKEGAITGRDEGNLEKAKKSKKDKKKEPPTKQTVIGGSTKSDMSKDVVNQQAKNDSTKFVKKTGISEGKVPSVSDMYNASKHLSNERFDAMMGEIRKNNKKKSATPQRDLVKKDPLMKDRKIDRSLERGEIHPSKKNDPSLVKPQRPVHNPPRRKRKRKI
jgi:hypothetical protein